MTNTNLLKSRNIIHRTSFSLSLDAHEAILKVAKLERVSIARAINEIIVAVRELEKMGKMGRLEPSVKPNIKRVRKTYAIYLDDLTLIKKRAEADNISRDLLLETIALKIEPLLINEDTLQLRSYLQLYEGYFVSLWKHIKKVEKVIVSELDKNDPLVKKYRTQVNNFENLVDFIKKDLPEDIE